MSQVGAVPHKRKRKEIGGSNDTEDEAEFARRWAESLTHVGGESRQLPSKGGKSVAVWLSKHRVAVVVVSKGKMISSMGVTGVGGQLLLLAEEALYLAERSYLSLYDAGDAAVKNFTDVVAMWKASGGNNAEFLDSGKNLTGFSRLASTRELYAALTEAAGLPLPCYLTYRALRDREFALRRPSLFTKQTPDIVETQLSSSSAATAAASSSSSFSPEYPSSSSDSLAIHHSTVSRQTPLRLSPSTLAPDVPLHCPGAPLDLSSIAFEAFPWTSTFSKTRCGIPDFVIIVVRACDQCPPLSDLRSLSSLVSVSPSSLSALTSSASKPAHPPCAFNDERAQSTTQQQATQTQLKVATVDDEGSVHVLSIGGERTGNPVRKHRQHHLQLIN